MLKLATHAFAIVELYMRSGYHAYLPAIMSGLLLGLSYPPYPFPGLGLVALIPVLRDAINEPTHRKAYLKGYITWQLVGAISFFWLLLHEFAHTALASATGFILYPMLTAIPFAGLPLLKKLPYRWLGGAAFLAWQLLIEWLLSHGFWAMPLGLLGHTLTMASPLFPIASIGGVALLTALVVTTNLVFALSKQPFPQWRNVLGVLIALGIITLAGRGMPTQSVGQIRVSVVQPAMTPLSWSQVRDYHRVDSLIERSKSALVDSPDLILWPETALPIQDSSLAAHASRTRLEDWVDTTGIPLATGAIVDRGDGGMLNSVLLVGGQSGTQRYDKLKLIPLAEYSPLANLTVDAGGVASYFPGHAPVILQTEQAALGPLVCYEGFFGDYARRFPQMGANWLAVLGQTGWWGSYPGPEQSLYFFRLRAVENGRALVVSTVAGPSAMITPDGTIHRFSAWMEPIVQTLDVPLYNHTTFYSRFGDLPLLLLALLLASLTGLWAMAKRVGPHTS